MVAVAIRDNNKKNGSKIILHICLLLKWSLSWETSQEHLISQVNPSWMTIINFINHKEITDTQLYYLPSVWKSYSYVIRGCNNKYPWIFDIKRHLTNTWQIIKAALLRWIMGKAFIIKATVVLNYPLAACVQDVLRDKSLEMGHVRKAHYSEEYILSIIHCSLPLYNLKDIPVSANSWRQICRDNFAFVAAM